MSWYKLQVKDSAAINRRFKESRHSINSLKERTLQKIHADTSHSKRQHADVQFNAPNTSEIDFNLQEFQEEKN